MTTPKQSVEDTNKDVIIPRFAVYDPRTEQITCPDGSSIPYKRQPSNKETDSNSQKSMRGDEPVCEVISLASASLGSTSFLRYIDGNYGLANDYPAMGGPWAPAFNVNGQVWINLGGL